MANKEGIQIFGRLVSATSEHILAHADEILVEEATESKPAVTVQDRLDSAPALDENISMLAINQWPRTVIKSITPGLSNVDGELYITPPFAEDDPDIVLAVKVNNTRYNVGIPSEHIVYTARDTRKQYLWNGESFVEIAGSGSGNATPDIGDILNINDNTRYRVWIGTQEQFDALDSLLSDVVYFVGTNPGGDQPSITPTGETLYMIEKHLTHCFINDDRTSIQEGDTYNVRVTVEDGYTLSTVRITMGGNDVTNDVWLPNDTDTAGIIDISGEGVIGKVVITATAVSVPVPLDHIGLSSSQDELNPNAILVTAIFYPSDTTEIDLLWSIDNTSDFTLITEGPNNTGSRARIIIKPDTVEADVTITCTPLYGQSVSLDFYDLSYDSGETPVDPDEPVDDDIIVFEDPVVEEILLPYFGTGPEGEKVIRKSIAATNPGGLTETQQQRIFMDSSRRSEVTTFNEWKWFTGIKLNVSYCPNLAEVKLPLLSGNTIVDSKFGLYDNKITYLEIPNGYTQIGIPGGSNPFGGGTHTNIISTIKFPSSLVSLPLGLSGLKSLVVLDLSTTQVSSLPSKAFQSLTSLKAALLPDTLKSITLNQTFKECNNVLYVEFGDEFEGVTYSGGLFSTNNTTTQSSVVIAFRSETLPSGFEFYDSAKKPIKEIWIPSTVTQEIEAGYQAAFPGKTVVKKAIQSTGDYAGHFDYSEFL